jgi:hypothetical protein
MQPTTAEMLTKQQVKAREVGFLVARECGIMWPWIATGYG